MPRIVDIDNIGIEALFVLKFLQQLNCGLTLVCKINSKSAEKQTGKVSTNLLWLTCARRRDRKGLQAREKKTTLSATQYVLH